jgi:hypothetical protein
MAEGFGLYLDPKTITESTASRKNVLKVPTEAENDTLYVKNETERKWREHMVVKDTKMGPWPDDKDVVVVTVQYQVTDEHYELNAGRIMTKNYFITIPAITDSTHKQYKKTMMNLGKLNQLVRSCGLEIEKDDSGRVPYHTYFNDDKPLVGVTFWAVIRDYVWMKDGSPNPDQDIDNFIQEK